MCHVLRFTIETYNTVTIRLAPSVTTAAADTVQTSQLLSSTSQGQGEVNKTFCCS